MPVERPTVAVQDYLKAIYHVEEDTGRLWVTTSELARALGVSAPSASAMLKRLTGLGYVVGGARRGSFALSGPGRAAALEVIRHHRLLEAFLVSRLGVPLSEVHLEAEVLEHHISESLEARIAEDLGHPRLDPHGSPIPTLEGDVAPVSATSIADLPPGSRAVVTRIDDRDASLVRGLEHAGVVPGAGIRIEARDPAGTVTVGIGDDRVRLPAPAASAVRVSPEE